jgi:hypothetical protein
VLKRWALCRLTCGRWFGWYWEESGAEAAACGASQPTSGFTVPGVDPNAALRRLWLALGD